MFTSPGNTAHENIISQHFVWKYAFYVLDNFDKELMYVVRHYSWGDTNKCLVTQDRELMTDIKDTIKVQW